eukprot:scaffold16062_cov81-Phaeocystis_antarctica.AAC.4
MQRARAERRYVCAPRAGRLHHMPRGSIGACAPEIPESWQTGRSEDAMRPSESSAGTACRRGEVALPSKGTPSRPCAQRNDTGCATPRASGEHPAEALVRLSAGAGALPKARRPLKLSRWPFVQSATQWHPMLPTWIFGAARLPEISCADRCLPLIRDCARSTAQGAGGVGTSRRATGRRATEARELVYPIP